MSLGRHLLLVLALAMTIATSSAASAQRSWPVQASAPHFDEGALVADLDTSTLLDRDARRALESGTQKRLVVVAEAFVEGRSAPVAHVEVRCEVIYDVWEEHYLVRRDGRRRVARDLSAVIRRCLRVSGARFGDRATWARHAGRRAYLGIRAEFNPISPRECRRRLRTPGSDDLMGPLVVPLIEREVCRAARALQFRTPSITVP